MAKNRIITGLDIGTHSLKALSVVQKNNSAVLEVLGFVEVPSFGVRRGVVFDIDKVSSKITEALNQLQENTGRKIEDVYTNISGSHIFFTSSRGTVIVSRADRKISAEDVSRALQAARAFSIPSNNEILEVFPKEFIIDGHGKIREPKEMEGVRLEAEVMALCAFSPYKNNLTSAVLNADFQISDIIPSFLASSRAVLTPQQKELGVCLLDIGGGTTNFVVYQEGDLIHASVFPIGSDHITSDLAVALKTDVELAEQIKKEYGTCIAKGKSKKEKIETENGEILAFSLKILTGVIGARLSDVCDLAKQELKKFGPQFLLPAGVVLTGGGSKIPRIVEFVRKELKLPARIGLPQNLEGLDKDPGLSTVCGLVLAGCETAGGRDLLFPKTGLMAKVKKMLRVFTTS